MTAVVGTEVVIACGASSPFSSWTRSLASTLHCRHGPKGPGARLVDFEDAGSTPTPPFQGGDAWRFCTRAVRGSTFTRTRSSRQSAACPFRPTMRCARSRRRHAASSNSQVADRKCVYACRARGHGRLLEAALAPARGGLRDGARQRATRPQRARTEDRRERRGVARRPACSRPDPWELRTAREDQSCGTSRGRASSSSARRPSTC